MRARPRPSGPAFTRLGGMCPRCEGMGAVTDFDLSALYDEQPVPQRGRVDDPGLQHGRLVRPHLPRVRLVRPGQADQQVHEEGTARPAAQGVDEDQGRRDQPDLPRPDPADPEVVPVQGRRLPAAAHPSLRGAGGDVHDLSRLRRHPAQQGGTLVEDRGEEHRRRLLDADQRPRRLGPLPRRAVRGAAADRLCSTSSTRSPRSGSGTSRSTVRQGRSPGERPSGPR